MPRVSRAEAERNRIEIERVSSRLMRERGLSVSVADVMGAAGLTHGGFYKHFESKDDLIAVSCANAFGEAAADWNASVARSAGGDDERATLIADYLEASNRQDAGEGCPMAALATDVARSAPDAPVRDAFREGFEGLLDILTRTEPGGDAGVSARVDALADVSLMVGALVLARATAGDALSDEILAAARRALIGENLGD
ncbi:TetR family transcriptional regulator [Mycetocola tolaasinivorans]|uniref:TetR family transcriptional regulator n=1 Tax=Mycetocola tolaasinivorans TaxID=76635 RepID=A0A3L7A946_9MICO|nr:TetR family transcriptional regulator [Mycetocola tolaasinivorans]RLP76101.1 TetR family transcriptional regulator [Mycetocola tolaasinivorans]